MTEYAIALIALAGLAILSKRHDIIMSALVVAGSWALWCIFIVMTNIYEPWHFGILLDSAAAWFLLRSPSSRPKAVIGAMFAVQIAMHVAYGAVALTTGGADHQGYYSHLSIIGWGQLFIAGVWGGGATIRRIMPVRDRVAVSRRLQHHRDMGP